MLLALGFLIRFEQYTNEHNDKWKYSTFWFYKLVGCPQKSKMLEGFPPMLHPWSHWQKWGNPEACSKPKASKTHVLWVFWSFTNLTRTSRNVRSVTFRTPNGHGSHFLFPPKNRYRYLANAQVRYLGLVKPKDWRLRNPRIPNRSIGEEYQVIASMQCVCISDIDLNITFFGGKYLYINYVYNFFHTPGGCFGKTLTNNN